jgi:hypothetical protein
VNKNQITITFVVKVDKIKDKFQVVNIKVIIVYKIIAGTSIVAIIAIFAYVKLR